MSRRHYRVRQKGASLNVRLRVAGRTEWPALAGVVEDLSSEGARVELADVTAEMSEALAELPEGAALTVSFEAVFLLHPFELDAAVVYWDGDNHRLGISFPSPDDVDARIPFVLRSDFNRRRMRRVVLKETLEVTVEGLGKGGPVLGKVLDLSTGGMRLQLRNGRGDGLEAGDRLRFDFALPGESSALTLNGDLLDRRELPGGSLLQTAFDCPSAEEEWLYARIETFVEEQLAAGGLAPSDEEPTALED